jgi:hypothetical protein
MTEAEAQSASERKKRVFAEKYLAEANVKITNLWELPQ